MLTSRFAASPRVWVLCAFSACVVACGGSNFDFEDNGDGGDDTGAGGDSGGGTQDGAHDAVGDTRSDGGGSDARDGGPTPDAPPPSDAGDTGSPPPDTTPPPPTCVAPTADSTNLYVDGSVGTTGKGDAGCPFKTILEATSFPLTTGVVRTIHVAHGSYDETDVLHVKGTVTLQGEGGGAALSGGSTGACSPAPDTCDIFIDPGGKVDGFDIDASKNGNGIVVAPSSASGAAPAVVSNTGVGKAIKDGIVMLGSAELGPNIHANENGNSGAAIRSGNLHVIAGTNSFDDNHGKGAFVGGTFIPAAGVMLFGAATLTFEGGSASGNAADGVSFDWGSAASTGKNTVSSLVASNNAGIGLQVPQGVANLTLRESTLTKNNIGAWFGFTGTISNAFDIGTVTAGGNNVFGGASSNNAKVGVFFCHSGKTASQPGEGDEWSVCPATQVQVSNCDSLPASYADVGYAVSASVVPTSAGTNPVTTVTCSVGP